MDNSGIPEEYVERLLDRPRGFLTDSDREYLVGNKDFSGNEDPEGAERQQRYRIRDRARHAIIDFILASEFLDLSDSEQLFHGFMTGNIDGEDLLLLEGYNSLITLFWLHVGAGPGESTALLRESTLGAIEEALKFHTASLDAHVKVDLDIQTTPYEELAERYRKGEKLTKQQVEELAKRGLIEVP